LLPKGLDLGFLFWHVVIQFYTVPSVLSHCWLGSRKGIRPVKTEWWGAVVVISLELGVDLHTAQLMPLPRTVSCFSKIQIGFIFLVLAYPGSPGQRAVKWVYVRYTVLLPACCSQLIEYRWCSVAGSSMRVSGVTRSPLTLTFRPLTSSTCHATSADRSNALRTTCLLSRYVYHAVAPAATAVVTKSLVSEIASFIDSVLMVWSRVLRPTRHKIGHFRDVFPSQCLDQY